MEELYAGMDLHTRNTYIEIMEKDSKKKVFEKRVPNDLSLILGVFEPFKDRLQEWSPPTTGTGLWMA
ncbi:MAG: hypothetical protein JRJ77_16450 [Deltaproteobacteria bacterium]|nr:hypothetical protein [Deltaproteobacteria bacterium]